MGTSNVHNTYGAGALDISNVPITYGAATLGISNVPGDIAGTVDILHVTHANDVGAFGV